MGCGYNKDDIIKYIEDEFPLEIKVKVEAHLNVCRECKGFYDVLMLSGQFARSSAPLRKSFKSEIMAAVDQQRYNDHKSAFKIRAILGSLNDVHRPAAVLAVICVIAISIFIGRWQMVPFLEKISHGPDTTNTTSTPAPVRNTEVVTSPADFIGLKMLDDNYGWGYTRNKIFRTVDGGKNWYNVTPGEMEGAVEDAYFTGRDTGWTALQRLSEDKLVTEIYRTENSGQSWTKSLLPDTGFGIDRVKIYFVNAKYGWILSSAQPATNMMFKAVFRTENGGESWETTADVSYDTKANRWVTGDDDLKPVGYPQGISFQDTSTGWMTVKERDKNRTDLLKSEDGGKSWHVQKLKSPDGYNSDAYFTTVYPPVFISSSDRDGIMLTGYSKESNTGKGVVIPYVTQDGGENWESTGEIQVSSIEGLSYEFISSREGYILNPDGTVIYYTNNGGRTWKHVKPDINLQGGIISCNVKGIRAIANGKFLNSDDGGWHWQDVNIQPVPVVRSTVTVGIGNGDGLKDVENGAVVEVDDAEYPSGEVPVTVHFQGDLPPDLSTVRAVINPPGNWKIVPKESPDKKTYNFGVKITDPLISGEVEITVAAKGGWSIAAEPFRFQIKTSDSMVPNSRAYQILSKVMDVDRTQDRLNSITVKVERLMSAGGAIDMENPIKVVFNEELKGRKIDVQQGRRIIVTTTLFSGNGRQEYRAALESYLYSRNGRFYDSYGNVVDIADVAASLGPYRMMTVEDYANDPQVKSFGIAVKGTDQPVQLDLFDAVEKAKEIAGAPAADQRPTFTVLLAGYSSKYPQSPESKKKLENVPAWIVIFHDVTLERGGGAKIGSGGAVKDDNNHSVIAEMNIVIDANTGKELSNFAYSKQNNEN